MMPKCSWRKIDSKPRFKLSWIHFLNRCLDKYSFLLSGILTSCSFATESLERHCLHHPPKMPKNPIDSYCHAICRLFNSSKFAWQNQPHRSIDVVFAENIIQTKYRLYNILFTEDYRHPPHTIFTAFVNNAKLEYFERKKTYSVTFWIR